MRYIDPRRMQPLRHAVHLGSSLFARLVVALIGAFLLVPTSFAQTSVSWVPAGVGNWSSNINWSGPSGSFVPEGRLGEQAVINSGGTAQVNTVFDNTGTARFGPGNILLGEGAGQSGAMEVLSGGAMTLDGLTGSLAVGQAGQGTLTIRPGGVVNADLLSSAGPNSLIDLSGNARLNVAGAASLGARTRIQGSGVSFSAGSLGLGGAHTLRTEINGPTFSTIAVGGPASLAGTLDVSFSGITPALGNSWNLIDAGSVTGAFQTINVTGLGALDPNLVGVRTLPGGIVQLALEQKLKLTVNRDSGAVNIVNSGTSAVQFDGYTVTSPSGSLNRTGGWTPLQSNAATPGWQVSESSNRNRVTETRPVGATSLANSSLSLGNLYGPGGASSAVFGQNLEDVGFQYVTLAGGVVDALVEYSGAPIVNNLVLIVDPATGNAQISNPSPFDVSIDGYTITSDGSSLLNTWTGLDGNVAAHTGWQRTESSHSGRLTELNPTGVQPMAKNSGLSLNLGRIFSGGAQDLKFEFLLAANTQPTTGIVLYQPLNPAFGADFDKDGDVDRNDFLAWQANFAKPSGATMSQGDANMDGDVDGGDFLLWQAQFRLGGGASAAAAAVPEPATTTLGLLAMVVGAVGVARRR